MLSVREEIVLRTDHSALNYLRKFVDNNSRLLRWSLRLAEFDFTVEHRPGTQTSLVDSLSRAIKRVKCSQKLPRDEVMTAQVRDKFCQKLDVGGVKSSQYFAEGMQLFIDA